MLRITLSVALLLSVAATNTRLAAQTTLPRLGTLVATHVSTVSEPQSGAFHAFSAVDTSGTFALLSSSFDTLLSVDLRDGALWPYFGYASLVPADIAGLGAQGGYAITAYLLTAQGDRAYRTYFVRADGTIASTFEGATHARFLAYGRDYLRLRGLGSSDYVLYDLGTSSTLLHRVDVRSLQYATAGDARFSILTTDERIVTFDALAQPLDSFAVHDFFPGLAPSEVRVRSVFGTDLLDDGLLDFAVDLQEDNASFVHAGVYDATGRRILVDSFPVGGDRLQAADRYTTGYLSYARPSGVEVATYAPEDLRVLYRASDDNADATYFSILFGGALFRYRGDSLVIVEPENLDRIASLPLELRYDGRELEYTWWLDDGGQPVRGARWGYRESTQAGEPGVFAMFDADLAPVAVVPESEASNFVRVYDGGEGYFVSYAFLGWDTKTEYAVYDFPETVSTRAARDQAPEIVVFPSPSAETITVLPDGRSATAELSLVDPRGRVAMQLDGYELGSPVAVGHLPAGTYAVSVRLADGRSSTTQVVITE